MEYIIFLLIMHGAVTTATAPEREEVRIFPKQVVTAALKDGKVVISSKPNGTTKEVTIDGAPANEAVQTDNGVQFVKTGMRTSEKFCVK